jgi:outer membrane lipoprotein-sorting protein
MVRWPIRFGLFALLLRMALAQAHPDVAQILKKVGETYKAASQYEFVADTTFHDARTGKDGSAHMRVAFKGPNKYRLEGGIPGMSSGGLDFSDGLIIHDGSAVWFYLPKSNQYASVPASALTAEAQGDLGDLRPETVDQFMMSRYRGAADLATGSKFLREESIAIAGGKIAAYVVAVAGDRERPVSTWWVDQKRYLILREDQEDSSVVYTSVKLGQPLAAGQFQFVPPPGAKKIEMHE